MAVAPIRTRPLIAVLSRVPLFVEAVNAAFEGIADVQPVLAAELQAHGLVRAFRPNAVILEGVEAGEFVDPSIPCVRVDLEAQKVDMRLSGVWTSVDIELSPEAIRNVVVAALYGGDPT